MRDFPQPFCFAAAKLSAEGASEFAEGAEKRLRAFGARRAPLSFLRDLRESTCALCAELF
jgi:hypothetical protein